MKPVAKYNTCKACSTVLTIGAPIITLLSCGGSFITNRGTTLSITGVLVLLILALFFKDKILENFKVPSAFVLSTILFVLIILFEKILLPMKIVCIVTMITSGVDELTFKRFYKNIEISLTDKVKTYKHVGFIFTTSENLGV